MSADGVEAESLTGSTSYCSYTSNGETIVATSFSASDGEMVWAAYQNDGPSVSGIGDKAVFSESSGTLFVVKGPASSGSLRARARWTPPTARIWKSSGRDADPEQRGKHAERGLDRVAPAGKRDAHLV